MSHGSSHLKMLSNVFVINAIIHKISRHLIALNFSTKVINTEHFYVLEMRIRTFCSSFCATVFTRSNQNFLQLLKLFFHFTGSNSVDHSEAAPLLAFHWKLNIPSLLASRLRLFWEHCILGVLPFHNSWAQFIWDWKSDR